MSEKPQLQGVKTKQRKREKVVQYDPSNFREIFLKTISELNPEDADFETKYQEAVESMADSLDYKRYFEPLFELLILGGFLAPGGNIDSPKNPYSCFAVENTVESVKKRSEVFPRLTRRHKYLEKRLGEALLHILQYINKFSSEESEKLSKLVGILMASGMLPLQILGVLLKDHLVKEGASLQFITGVFKSYLKEQSMDHLSVAMKKSGVDDKLIDFFPPNQRDSDSLAKHFESVGLKGVVEFHSKKTQASIREQIINGIKELIQHGRPVAETIKYIKQEIATQKWTDTDAVSIAWSGLIHSVDWGNKADQVELYLNKQLSAYYKLLAEFATSPKNELTLLLKIQQSCYEDARLTKYFRMTVSSLYQKDVLSESAVLFWYEKGASSMGKTMFQKQMEPFINWLKNAEEEESEEEDEEE